MDHGHHALVGGGLSQQGQLLPRFPQNADAVLAAEIDQLLEPRILALPSHDHVVKTPPAGPDCLFHRMQPVQSFHSQ